MVGSTLSCSWVPIGSQDCVRVLERRPEHRRLSPAPHPGILSLTCIPRSSLPGPRVRYDPRHLLLGGLPIPGRELEQPPGGMHGGTAEHVAERGRHDPHRAWWPTPRPEHRQPVVVRANCCGERSKSHHGFDAPSHPPNNTHSGTNTIRPRPNP